MKSYLADVNVWVALCSDRHIHYAAAQDWFAGVAPAGVSFCRLAQLGLLRLLTNSKVMGRDVVSPARAWHVYDLLCEDLRVTFAAEPLEMEPAFRSLTRNRIAGSGLWTDAYLAALAKARGLTVVSFDRGFRGMPGVDSLILPAH
jgi:uncharacterized protein